VKEKIQAIKALPYHKSIGVKDIISESGNATLTAEVTENTLNPAGYYHGGIIYTLCDVCAYSGILSVLKPHEDAVTHDIHISVLRPARLGDQIIYKSNVVKQGRSLCFIDVEVTVLNKIIATARITKSKTK